MIVDDDLCFRRILHLALESHGYEVENAADGKEALDRFAAHAPDLVVLDWHLPGMDGIATCQALRQRSGVPVILASANRRNSQAAALAAGANDYLPKPFSIDQLLACVESVLGHSTGPAVPAGRL